VALYSFARAGSFTYATTLVKTARSDGRTTHHASSPTAARLFEGSASSIQYCHCSVSKEGNKPAATSSCPHMQKLNDLHGRPMFNVVSGVTFHIHDTNSSSSKEFDDEEEEEDCRGRYQCVVELELDYHNYAPSLRQIRRSISDIENLIGNCLSGRRRRACALASVRRPNCTYGFPVCSFHEDSATPGCKRRN